MARTDRDYGELSFVRGGPFYRAQQAAKLIRPNEWNHARRLIFVMVLGWLPLVLMTGLFNSGGLSSLLVDYRVHARMLIAVPALLFGQSLMESRFRAVIAHIDNAGILAPSDLARMDEIIATLLRLGDSWIPELAIVILLFVHTATSFKGLLDSAPWLAQGTPPDLHLTAAGWYTVLVSTTLFQLLLGLGLWKWLLWTLFAFKLSRLDLKLVPTHPDSHGGLGFLSLTPAACTPIIFAASCVIGATWRHEILHGGATLMTFKIPAIVLAVIIAVVALGPLAFFAPRLDALRRRGILEYGVLGQLHSADFHEKWIFQRNGHEAEFLTAPDCGSLYAFGASYQSIARLSPFPADRGAFIGLAVAAAVPMLPVIVAVVPLTVVFEDLLKALR